jgi:hypothetical protein
VSEERRPPGRSGCRRWAGRGVWHKRRRRRPAPQRRARWPHPGQGQAGGRRGELHRDSFFAAPTGTHASASPTGRRPPTTVQVLGHPARPTGPARLPLICCSRARSQPTCPLPPDGAVAGPRRQSTARDDLKYRASQSRTSGASPDQPGSYAPGTLAAINSQGSLPEPMPLGVAGGGGIGATPACIAKAASDLNRSAPAVSTSSLAAEWTTELPLAGYDLRGETSRPSRPSSRDAEALLC